MSNVYTATLNGITYHPINFPHGGAITLENASRWWLYVAIGYYANVSDVKSFAVASVAPGQTRMFGMNLQQQSPVLSIATTDKPFALTSTVNQTPDVIRIEEIASASGAVPFPDNPSTGLIADYLVIAGGQIRMDQNAIYAHDLLSNPVIMINMLAGAVWNGQTLNVGDVVIGTYNTGDGLYWNAQGQTLLIKGNVSVTGGNAALNIQGVDGTWTSTSPTQLNWAGVHVEYGGGKPLKTLTDGSHTLTVAVEYGYILDSDNLLHWQTNIQNIPTNATTIVCAISGILKVTIQVLVGTTWISGDQIVTGSIGANRLSVNQLSAITADVGEVTSGTITGLLIRTAVSGARLELTSNILARYLSTNFVSLDEWFDLSSNLLAQVLGQDSGDGGYLIFKTVTKPGIGDGNNHIQFMAAANANRPSGATIFDLLNASSVIPYGQTSGQQGGFPWLNVSGQKINFQTWPVYTEKEVYGNGDLWGLYNRLVERGSVANDHFRSGVIPTNYVWQAAPFNGTPGLLAYSNSNDYLRVAEPTAANRYFLSHQITNQAAAWQNKELRVRISSGFNGRGGCRFDDGTDNNYVELLCDGTANNATQTLIFRYRAGGGAITTVTSAVAIPAGNYFVLRLLCLFVTPNYQGFGYLLQEPSAAINILNFNTPNLAWIPAAGRAGLIYDFPGASNYVYADWLSNNFG